MRRVAVCIVLCLVLGACNRAPPNAPHTATEVTAAAMGAELRDFDRDIIAALRKLAGSQRTPEEKAVLARGTTLNGGATLDDVRALERRIGRRLAPSYREFLLASNGMLFHGSLNVVTMQPAAAVEPLTTKNYPTLDAWVAMPDVAIPLDPTAGGPLPGPTLAHAWAISSVEDGDVYLIFPELVRPDGEWPVWFFGSKNRGAIAYPSFAAMFGREKARALEELGQR